MAFVRAFGLLQPDRTPCGRPVSVSKAHVLMELEKEGSLSQKELGERLLLERSTVSRLVKDMEQGGWITREPDASDARVLRLGLTPEGQRVAAEFAKARQAKFLQILSRIPESERTGVLHALTVLVEAMQAGHKNEERIP